MSSLNDLIKQKLKKKARQRKVWKSIKLVFRGSSVAVFYGLPMAALAFASYLAWQSQSFEFRQPERANASELAANIDLDKQEQGGSQILDNQDDKDTEDKTIEYKIKKIADQIDLKIPLIKQEYALSCEVASLQMALSHYDIQADQNELFEKLAKAEPPEMQVKDDQIIWGDPDIGFVGEVDGWFTGQDEKGKQSLKKATGWGVNNGPLKDLALQYRQKVEEIDQASLEDIQLALSNNYPVLWWHVSDEAIKETISITSPEGRQFEFGQMHVALITGYYEDDKGDIVYLLNDPNLDEPTEINEIDLLRQWERYNKEILILG